MPAGPDRAATRFEPVRALLERAVAAGEIPGAQALVGSAERILWRAEIGVRRYGGPVVDPDTRYDLASLTKVTATLPAVLSLVGEGRMTLDDPVRRFVSSAGWFQTPSLADATVRQLLSHSSGLPAWVPLFARVSTRRTAVAHILQTPLEHPAGSVVYSDLGFILLGHLVERVSGERLDRFVRERLHAPLGMESAGFGPVTGAPVAATEDCGWRGLLLEGVVHDENAWVMEGVAGHAGLFGTADDLARYARAWLRGDPVLAPPELLAEAVREAAGGEAVRRALGWQLAHPGASSGAGLGPRAFGHTGFTGTSLWLDPDQDRFYVLLTNRVHPDRTRGAGIHALRVAFHDTAVAAEAQARRGSEEPT